MTKVIRLLRVFKNQTQVYLCSNLGTFSNQLCENNDNFRVEQEQTCIEPDINLCKFNMTLVLLNFSESDEGIYDVIIEFDNAPIGRGTLSRQFNITLLNGPPNSKSYKSIEGKMTHSDISAWPHAEITLKNILCFLQVFFLETQGKSLIFHSVINFIVFLAVFACSL